MLKKFAAAVLISAGLIAGGSSAFAATVPASPSCGDSCGSGASAGASHYGISVPTYNKAYQDFKKGGAAAGYGAATLVASAFTGVVADPVAIGIDTVRPGYIHWVDSCSGVCGH